MTHASSHRVAIIGGGPAGLMAAEVISAAGYRVDLYDAMPSVGRKFLLAGKGGLNITHSEALEQFIARYGEQSGVIAPMLQRFGPQALRDWVHGLGVETFVGTSGRVFPTEMKAAPLLRRWLHRLREGGVHIHVRHRWLGWREGALLFATPKGELSVMADAVVLALGGGSWRKLGSDGRWVELLQQQQIDVAALRPANCGFEVKWSDHFRQRFAGVPLKPVVASFTDAAANSHSRQGEMMVTEHGLEGSLIYALSAPLRDTIEAKGSVTLVLDLLPGRELERVVRELSQGRGAKSLSHHLRSRLGIDGVKAGLLYEVADKQQLGDMRALATLLKALPVTLCATRPIDEAISTAGGVRFDEVNPQLMIKTHPGLLCAGEMLDWEAPTGGYLLTACFASGVVAGEGVVAWLGKEKTC